MGPGRDMAASRRSPSDAKTDWGETRLDFGRYAGWRLADVARSDADYLRWLSRHSAGVRFREQIRALLRDEADLDRPASSLRWARRPP
jgi:hypothetical protein